jgi:uncharacterized protein (TIGR01777 family)
MTLIQNNVNNDHIPSVLISGGSGLIGRYLTSKLLGEGYKVSHLSRQTDGSGNVRVFSWGSGDLNPGVFEGIDYLVNLSGANIGEKRWTKRRKEEILNSRVRSTELLFKTIAGNKINLKAYIAASAAGYYGSVTSDKIFSEDDAPGGDFLGSVCRLWEEGADQFAGLGIRTVKIRTAVVLEKHDSALSRLMTPARFGLVTRLGNGKQYFPWIHINDLCNIYLKAITDENMLGAYNAVAPQHINHNDFVRTMAAEMKRPVFLPPVPAPILRLVLGEMSDIVLKGSRISSDKIVGAGYKFRFARLDEALKSVISG